jgi:hypothetical protein
MIVSILLGIAVATMIVLPERARTRATEALVAKLDAELSSLVQRFASSQTIARVLPVDTQLALSPSGGANRTRAAVIARTRALRQVFPEYFLVNHNRVKNGSDDDSDGVIDNPAEAVVFAQWRGIDLDGDGTPDQLASQLPPVCATYEAYVNANLSSPESHIGATTRAECLYMIIMASGGDVEERFLPEEVGDTDGDGLKEFVDKWGRPIQFFLWPTYYLSEAQNGQESDPDDPHQTLLDQDWWNSQQREHFERLYKPLRFPLPRKPAPSSPEPSYQPRSYRTVALIVSAGADGGWGFEIEHDTNRDWRGADAIMGTLDDGHVPGNAIDWPIGVRVVSNQFISQSIVISAAIRVRFPDIEGYAMDQDNIDNHSLRAH